MTPILLKPKGETMKHSKQHKRKQLQEIGVSQGDIQQLLNFLRSSLTSATIDKDYCKYLAKKLWEKCDKEDLQTAHIFEGFSNVNSQYKQYKQKEKNLVSLIKKLKSLQ